MHQESSQSDLAERDVPTRSGASEVSWRSCGGRAGAGAERVCLSVRVSVSLPPPPPPQSLLSCLGHTHTTNPPLLHGYHGVDAASSPAASWIHRCPPPVSVSVFTAELRDVQSVGCSRAHRGGGGGGGRLSFSFYQADYQADSPLECLNTEEEEKEEV